MIYHTGSQLPESSSEENLGVEIGPSITRKPYKENCKGSEWYTGEYRNCLQDHGQRYVQKNIYSLLDPEYA